MKTEFNFIFKSIKGVDVDKLNEGQLKRFSRIKEDLVRSIATKNLDYLIKFHINANSDVLIHKEREKAQITFYFIKIGFHLVENIKGEELEKLLTSTQLTFNGFAQKNKQLCSNYGVIVDIEVNTINEA